jgi:hypothetical protein
MASVYARDAEFPYLGTLDKERRFSLQRHERIPTKSTPLKCWDRRNSNGGTIMRIGHPEDREHVTWVARKVEKAKVYESKIEKGERIQTKYTLFESCCSRESNGGVFHGRRRRKATEILTKLS